MHGFDGVTKDEHERQRQKQDEQDADGPPADPAAAKRPAERARDCVQAFAAAGVGADTAAARWTLRT